MILHTSAHMPRKRGTRYKNIPDPYAETDRVASPFWKKRCKTDRGALTTSPVPRSSVLSARTMAMATASDLSRDMMRTRNGMLSAGPLEDAGRNENGPMSSMEERGKQRAAPSYSS